MLILASFFVLIYGHKHCDYFQFVVSLEGKINSSFHSVYGARLVHVISCVVLISPKYYQWKPWQSTWYNQVFVLEVSLKCRYNAEHKSKSEFVFTTHTPYLAPTGGLWGVKFGDELAEN